MDVYNTHIAPLASMYFIRFCKFYGLAKEYLLNLYATNEIIKIITDKSYMTYLQSYCFLIGQKMEPESVPWISSLWLESHPERVTQTIQLKESYTHNFTNIITADLFGLSDRAQYANQYFSKVSTELKEGQLNSLVIFKTEAIGPLEQIDDHYIVRRGGFAYDNLSFERTNAKFLSVEYTHPDLSVPIELKIDKAWLFVGNELFTPTFVLRMLDYQPVMYFFDEDYVMKIMDNNCRILTLKWNDYIVITKDGYEIKTADESAVLVDSDSF